jgi:uncharacterized membrane protein YdcZ (DUF606 family)
MNSNPAPIVRGMLWMAATGLIFVVMNTIMKRLSHELDPWLVGFLRYLLGAVVMLGPALRAGPRCWSGSRASSWWSNLGRAGASRAFRRECC